MQRSYRETCAADMCEAISASRPLRIRGRASASSLHSASWPLLRALGPRCHARAKESESEREREREIEHAHHRAAMRPSLLGSPPTSPPSPPTRASLAHSLETCRPRNGGGAVFRHTLLTLFGGVMRARERSSVCAWSFDHDGSPLGLMRRLEPHVLLMRRLANWCVAYATFGATCASCWKPETCMFLFSDKHNTCSQEAGSALLMLFVSALGALGMEFAFVYQLLAVVACTHDQGGTCGDIVSPLARPPHWPSSARTIASASRLCNRWSMRGGGGLGHHVSVLLSGGVVTWRGARCDTQSLMYVDMRVFACCEHRRI